MLPRSLRLTRRGFEENRGLRRAHSPHFFISYGPAVDEGGSAVIVPKKAVKGAVARHLLKRRIRALLRPYSTRDRVIIVQAKAGAADISYEQMHEELSPLLESVVQ
jgi:ribonuclease P protein component